MQSISEKDADELSDTGQEQIGLKGSGTVRFTGIKREGILEDVNGSLNGDSVPVEVVPMVGVSGDAGIEAKVLVGIGVDTLAVRGIGARMFADAHSGRALGNGSGANPLETGRTVFPPDLPRKVKGLPVTGQMGVPEVSKSEDEALEFLGFMGIQARSKENSFLSME